MSADLTQEDVLAAVTDDAAALFDTTAETQLERVWNRVRNYSFRIVGCNIVLPAGLYSEVLIDPSIAPLPNSPAHFAGVTNLRGNLVPVYRLEPWLNRQCAASAPRYAVLVDEWSRGAALVIDEKPQALSLTDYELLTELPESLPGELAPMVEAVYAHDGDYWYLIDYQALFAHLSAAVEDPTASGF